VLCTNPSRCRTRRAWRTGARETPSLTASSFCRTRLPGVKLPLRIAARISATARAENKGSWLIGFTFEKTHSSSGFGLGVLDPEAIYTRNANFWKAGNHALNKFISSATLWPCQEVTVYSRGTAPFFASFRLLRHETSARSSFRLDYARWQGLAGAERTSSILMPRIRSRKSYP